MLTASASLKFGGLYGFCNSHGCDGDRLYFEGETLFALNGQIVDMGEMFSLKDVQRQEILLSRSQVVQFRSKFSMISLKAKFLDF